MNVEQLKSDITNGIYNYATMLYTSTRYSILDNKNRVIKDIPNPMVMEKFFKKPVRVYIKDNVLYNELGGELPLTDDRIEYENGDLMVYDLFTHDLQSGWRLSATKESYNNTTDYETIIKDLRMESRKRI